MDDITFGLQLYYNNNLSLTYLYFIVLFVYRVRIHYTYIIVRQKFF